MSAKAIYIAAGLVLGAVVSPALGQVSFDECEESLKSQGDSEQAAECFYQIAENQGEHDEAARRLRAHIGARPDAPWLRFFLGNVLWAIEVCHDETKEAYGEAVSLFSDRKDKANEIRALTSVAWLLARCGDFERAYETLRVAEEGKGSMDRVALARIRLVRLRLDMRSGKDLKAVSDSLRELWQEIEPLASDESAIWSLQRECLRALETLARRQGKVKKVKSWIDERLVRAREAGVHREEISALYSMETHKMAHRLPSDKTRRRILGQLRELLPLAEQGHYFQLEALIRLQIAEMEGGGDAESHLARCRQLAGNLADQRLQRRCVLALANQSLDRDPSGARRLLAEVYAGGMLTSDDPMAVLDEWRNHLQVLWATHPRHEALAGAERVLADIETLRGSQQGMARLDLLDVWADPYYWLAGRLLADGEDPRLAFQVMEQLRAQELREILLLDGDTETRLPAPPANLLDEVGSMLGEDEAMLSFQIALWQDYYGHFVGGAWVLVSTREETRVHRLERDRAWVEPGIQMLVDLEDGQWAEEPLTGLYASLLHSALEGLPPGIKRLVLIPDGKLHLLPFAALRSASDAPVLGEDYEISTEPSAALWLNWKQNAQAGVVPAALVFADPEPPSVAGSQNGSQVLRRGAGLGPLPHARREGKRVLRHLGGEGLLLQGAEANENFLKQADLEEYGLLHFATHAKAFADRPWESYVALASSDGSEDGVLQPDEIAALDLDGKVIVLSTCDSAGGGLWRGEGVMSLARAFFKAGAHAVIGTLKELPDDQVALFFDDFYGYLSDGQSLREALAATQRKWAAEGRPASIWAHIVVMGNGDLVPAPGGVEKTSWLWGALSGCLLAAGLLGLLNRRGR